MIQRPLYLSRIEPFIDQPIIKVVTGVRRSGKSTILEMIQVKLKESGVPSSHIISVNFELFSNRHLKKSEALYEFLKERMKNPESRSHSFYLFFDEIQEVEEWEKLIPGLQLEFDVDIYLTGSNAYFLSSDFATYLSGRYIEFKIYPFSFKEFCEIYFEGGEVNDERKAFEIYRVLGGFPFLANLNYEPALCREYLLGIYDTVVLKDMVERERIKDSSLLTQLLPYLMANIGHTFSGRSIERMLKGENISISIGAVLKYVQAACDANLFYRASRGDAMTKKVFKNQEKYYLVDHGMREAVYGNNERNIDQVLENIVFIELLRQGWSVNVGDAAYGESKGSSKEIDFIASRGSERKYFQVCYLLAEESTIKREFSSLETLRSDFPKYVLSLDEVDRSQNGITHLNVRDFLLDAESILR